MNQSDIESRRPFLARVQPMLDALATVAVIAVSGAVAWNAVRPGRNVPTRPSAPSSRPALAPPRDPVSLSGANVEGDPKAQVAIIEYSDFQCPYCGAFARDTLPSLREKFVKSGKVLLAFRQLPLPMHQFARKAAESAECAGRQQKFWPLHDQFFQRQGQLSDAEIESVVGAVGVDAQVFAQCLQADAPAMVQADSTSATTLGISGTPTFLIGVVQKDGRVKVSQIITGMQTLDRFEQAISSVSKS